MKIRFTPLNVISAILLLGSIYFILFGFAGSKISGAISFFLLALICFITDLIFRRLLLDIKRIWLFELLFIIFVAALIALIRGLIFN